MGTEKNVICVNLMEVSQEGTRRGDTGTRARVGYKKTWSEIREFIIVTLKNAVLFIRSRVCQTHSDDLAERSKVDTVNLVRQLQVLITLP